MVSKKYILVLFCKKVDYFEIKERRVALVSAVVTGKVDVRDYEK